MSEQDDPYRTPEQPVEDADRWGSGGLSVGRALEDGWGALTRNFWVLCGAALFGGILSLLATITCVGFFLVVPVLYYGMYRIALGALDDRADINDLWSGFQRYREVLAPMLAWLILMLVISMVGSIPGEILNRTMVNANDPGSVIFAFGLGQVISLVYAMFVSARIMVAPYFVVVEGAGGVEAIQRSWTITSPHKGTVALLALLMYALTFVGVLACFIGMIPAMAMMIVMGASAYRQLTAGQDGGGDGGGASLEDGWPSEARGS